MSPSQRRRPGADDEPVPVADALAALGAQLGLPDPRVLAPLTRAWPEVVGADVARHTRVRGFRDGVLVIGAAPGWASHVRYLVDTLAERANEVLGVSVVRVVQIVVEPVGETGSEGGAVVD